MQVQVNGNPTALADGVTVAALLRQLKVGERRVAVEVNGEIVPRSQAGETALREGDRVEIVQAIGGG